MGGAPGNRCFFPEPDGVNVGGADAASLLAPLLMQVVGKTLTRCLMAIKKKSDKVPKEMEKIFVNITDITDEFSKNYLNEEYREYIRYIVAALCRKRPSPILRGKPNTWACGITHALGSVNFLFDSSQSPHIRASDLYKAFGVSSGTGQAKSKQVREILKMFQFDTNWTLPSRMDANPMAWMITVNGMIVDVRSQPREIQEMALAKGLIPYLP